MHCNCDIKVCLVRLKIQNIEGIVISLFTKAFKGSHAYFYVFFNQTFCANIPVFNINL
jgi:hypothetical protein